MMISMMIFFIFIMFNLSNLYKGIFMFLLTFFFFLLDNYMLGMVNMKGSLFSVLGMDKISFYLILLLMWLSSIIMILFNMYIVNILMMMLMMMMFMMFLSLDMISLFIYFESSMLPMFMMIMFYGGYKERYLASLYMFIYTMLSSLPSLMFLMMVMNWMGGFTLDYMMYSCNNFNNFIKVVIVIMFLVKVPMFMVHVWLPKAHVEAPVFGSMVLASVMLKMGGYGVIRCNEIMDLDYFINDFFFFFCLVSILLLSYSCLYQVDLKVLVAYSSIIHMGFMLMGFFSGTELGYVGGVIMMISHGVCSSGLFYLVNEIYMITGSRLFIFNKGLMGVTPILCGFWLILLVNNLGVPPCFGILSELMLISGCLMNFFNIFFLFFFIIFFLSCFVMNMYSLLVGGKFMFKGVSVNLINYYGLMIHFVPLNFFIFFIINFM